MTAVSEGNSVRHKSVGLVWVLVVSALALMLPATAAAAYPYTYVLERDVGTRSGGYNGHGVVRLQVRMQEWGASGTEKFKAYVRLQRSTPGSRTWSTIKSWYNSSQVFNDDRTSHEWTVGRRHDFTATQSSGSYYHRLVMRMEWWEDNGGVAGEETLFEKTIYGKVC